MNELIVINPKDYGLEEMQANQIAEAFREPLAELAALETEYKNFKNLTGTPPESTCIEAKELLKKYVSNRTTRDTIHKTEKAYFLNGGKYVQAWKNKSLEVSNEREEKLKEIADYYVNIEKERIVKLTEKREKDLLSCQLEDDIYIPPKLGEMPEQAWNTYFAGVKKGYDEEIEHRRQEQLRQEKEEKKQQEEQERIRKENEQLKAEAEAKEKEIEKERIEREKIEAKKQAEIETERLIQQKKLEKEQAEIEKLKQEKREREEAELKAQKEKEEQAKQIALAPDKDKIVAFNSMLLTVKLPEVSSPEAKEIVRSINDYIINLTQKISERLKELN